MKSLSKRLQEVHSALDDALGDSECDWLSMRDLREERPVQWAASKLAKIMADLEIKERRKTAANKPSAKRRKAAASHVG